MTRLLLLATFPLAAQFGQFQNAIRAEFLPDGRKIELLADLVYVDGDGRHWIAPKGSTVDGASIPQSLWSLIGGPYEGLYREASVIHDVECQRKTAPWREVHKRFHAAMLARGVDSKLAMGMYAAVKVCGPQWLPDGTLVPSPACPATYVKPLLSWGRGGILLESTARASERAQRSVQTARADAKKWSAEVASAENASRLMQSAAVMLPRNESPAERSRREEREAAQRKVRDEAIRTRISSARAGSERANEALLQAEAELQNPTRRPLPPATIEEIEKLTIADFEP